MLTVTSTSDPTSGSDAADGHNGPSRSRVLYEETQRVPFSWWLLALGVSALIGWQSQMSRPTWVGVVAFIVVMGLAGWALWWMSRTRIRVVTDDDGERWLDVGDASLPASVVSRTMVVPHTAKSAAMGRQLDPAAFVVHKAWVPTMALLVLDDPDDPTPYWLVSSTAPDRLLAALDRPVV
ncbi:DUF3093 domain-containing protein [Corynebacterium bovis]|uniref:DUF3093 domain-containing protein n=1 Tax=Corynebacterium bovis TaxID=36808 RepID=A0A426Q1R1_9CORY|nr:DUF3093 domain-containing protein [Corynebacterium bovis]RRO87965.1 DUF3093 domain-containing protein [Corynebacterium bovis]RRO90429.1 DUF3093 domain-containing protein [Corynebacterium bovis]